MKKIWIESTYEALKVAEDLFWFGKSDIYNLFSRQPSFHVKEIEVS